MTGSTWMFAATRLLLRWGGGRPEVVADLVAKSGLGRRAAAQFWHGVSMEATRGEVPRELLERAEEELLTSKDRAVIWAAARVRLSGRHRSPSLEAATAVLAELPGPRRVWSLRALGAAETPGDRNRRSALEREALKSGDPAVLAEALWGVSNQCMRREPGAVCVLGEIQALKGHPDEQVRSAAEEALRVYWAMFEREDP